MTREERLEELIELWIDWQSDDIRYKDFWYACDEAGFSTDEVEEAALRSERLKQSWLSHLAII